MFILYVNGTTILIGEIGLHAIDGSKGHRQVHQTIWGLDDLHDRIDAREETVDNELLGTFM